MTNILQHLIENRSTQTGKLSSFVNYLALRAAARNCNAERMLILSAGPSLTKFLNMPLAYELIADPATLVVAIKQAALPLQSAPDIFCFNEVRYQPEFDGIGGLRLSVSENAKERRSHIHFPIYRYRRESSLIYTNNYKFWRYGMTPLRPWGVGIFFELAAHLPILFNIKKVTLAGFDMNNTGRFHFYDSNQDANAYNVDGWEFDLVPTSCAALEQYYRSEETSIEVFTTNPKLGFNNKVIV